MGQLSEGDPQAYLKRVLIFSSTWIPIYVPLHPFLGTMPPKKKFRQGISVGS